MFLLLKKSSRPNLETINMDKFLCKRCGKEVIAEGQIGTKNRNHCPFCLYSQHVDKNISGDRKENCHGLMKPIALTFKKEGVDKFGIVKQGEIMLVHRCEKCGDISINRIAADDDNEKILRIFESSKNLDQETSALLKQLMIEILDNDDLPQINRQLFGK